MVDPVTLVARQIAIFNHHVWDRLSPKQKIEYMTLARNIIATIERTR